MSSSRNLLHRERKLPLKLRQPIVNNINQVEEEEEKQKEEKDPSLQSKRQRIGDKAGIDVNSIKYEYKDEKAKDAKEEEEKEEEEEEKKEDDDTDNSTESILTQHVSNNYMTSTTQKWNCTQCLRSYSRKHGLHRHLTMHMGLKPYVCVHCDKSYNLLSSLRDHVQTHLTSHPFACSECTKKYTDRSSLRRHKKSHVGLKQYKCFYGACSRYFMRKDSRDSHRFICFSCWFSSFFFFFVFVCLCVYVLYICFKKNCGVGCVFVCVCVFGISCT